MPSNSLSILLKRIKEALTTLSLWWNRIESIMCLRETTCSFIYRSCKAKYQQCFLLVIANKTIPWALVSEMKLTIVSRHRKNLLKSFVERSETWVDDSQTSIQYSEHKHRNNSGQGIKDRKLEILVPIEVDLNLVGC